MKTLLPLREQPSFKIYLPQVLGLAPNVTLEEISDGVEVKRRASCLSINIPSAAKESLIHNLKEGWCTDNLSASWRQLLEHLLGAGMIMARGEAPAGSVHAADAFATISRAIDCASSQAFPPNHALNDLIKGECSLQTVKRWIIENYHFTAAARHHIAPVLDHDMSFLEREMWLRLLKDESWHWRIYRKVFTQLGLTFQNVDAMTPDPTTTALVSALTEAAIAGPVEYAAALVFIERPPMVACIEEDPLYGALLLKYGLERKSVQPLWWHALENRHSGHSSLPAVIISNRLHIAREVVGDACTRATQVVAVVGRWQQSILSRTPHEA